MEVGLSHSIWIWKLVQRFERNGQWFVKRQDGIFRLYCWSAYFTCVALLTIFFGSLFMASVKRHAELVSQGKETRLSLISYKEHLLDFLTNTFATTTIIAYATYTYVEKPPQTNSFFSGIVSNLFPSFEARKWMMITIPIVVYGIARYAQLLYEKSEGERPEKIITTDIPLVVTVFLGGIIVISLIYIF